MVTCIKRHLLLEGDRSLPYCADERFLDRREFVRCLSICWVFLWTSPNRYWLLYCKFPIPLRGLCLLLNPSRGLCPVLDPLGNLSLLLVPSMSLNLVLEPLRFLCCLRYPNRLCSCYGNRFPSCYGNKFCSCYGNRFCSCYGNMFCRCYCNRLCGYSWNRVCSCYGYRVSLRSKLGNGNTSKVLDRKSVV